MIYCYSNFFGDNFKVYIRDEVLAYDENMPLISFKEMKGFMENIKENKVKGIYYCEINNLEELLEILEIFNKTVYYKKGAKLYLNLRNCFAKSDE